MTKQKKVKVKQTNAENQIIKQLIILLYIFNLSFCKNKIINWAEIIHC